MQGKIYEIPLDISDGVLTSQIRELVTEDMGTNTFRFKVVRDKHIPYDFTGTIVRMMVKTPSGARIQQECTIENAVSGTVSLTLKQSLLLEHGSYIAELQIYDAITQSIRLTTPTFDYHVRQSLQNSESIIATDEYTILQEALADLAGINIVVANKADKSDVGDIEELETDEKANLVQAINEVKSQSNHIATSKIGWQLLSGIDLNTVFRKMEGYCVESCLNTPVSANGYFKCMETSDTGVAFAFQEYRVNTTGDYFYRVCYNGVWKPWQPIATTEKIDVLTLTNGWSAYNATFETSVCKVGNIVNVSMLIKNPAPNINNITILPYKPQKPQIMKAALNSANDVITIEAVRITTDGALHFQRVVPTHTWISIIDTYNL